MTILISIYLPDPIIKTPGYETKDKQFSNPDLNDVIHMYINRNILLQFIYYYIKIQNLKTL